MPKIEYCSRRHLAARETRSTGSAGRRLLSCVDESTCNVQLDQFSNISATGQCPGRAADATPVQGPGLNEIYLLIQMSRNEKDLSRTFIGVRAVFFFSFVPFLPTFSPSCRDAHKIFSLVLE